MKQIKCDVCGASDLVKDDGLFICQSCGCKYTDNEIKKLYIQLNESVSIDGVLTLQNLIDNATQFLNLNEFEKAYKTYEKITNDYPSCCYGWLGVAKSELLLKNSSNIDLAKINSFLDKAIHCSNEEQMDCVNQEVYEIREKIKFLLLERDKKQESDNQKYYEEQYKLLDIKEREHNLAEQRTKLKKLMFWSISFLFCFTIILFCFINGWVKVLLIPTLLFIYDWNMKLKYMPCFDDFGQSFRTVKNITLFILSLLSVLPMIFPTRNILSFIGIVLLLIVWFLQIAFRH